MTQESIRKHISQMSMEEISFCMEQVHNRSWGISKHVRDQLEERGGDIALLLETIGYGDLIEYHKRNGSSRLLLRSNKIIHNYVPCVVVAPISEYVVTVFWNHVLDRHRTIDMGRYDSDLDIIKLFKMEMERSK